MFYCILTFDLCVYLLGFVAVNDACITTDVLFSKLSISVKIGIIRVSYNVFITESYIKPRSQTVMPFDDVTLTCQVPSVSKQYDSRLSYTWHRIGGDIPVNSSEKTNCKLTILRFGLADEGEYYCMPEVFGHCAKSNTVTLTLDGEKVKNYSYRK